MKQLLTVLVLSIPTFLIGQKSVDRHILIKNYQQIDGLTIPDSISKNDLLGSIVTTNGFSGQLFFLDSNMSYREKSFDCMAKFLVDSGSWAITDRHNLILTSKMQMNCFSIFTYDNYYFFILPSQEKSFMRDIKTAKSILKYARSYEINGVKYAVNHLIGYYVAEKGKYYFKEGLPLVP